MQVSRYAAGTRRDAERVLNTLISKHETASVGGGRWLHDGDIRSADDGVARSRRAQSCVPNRHRGNKRLINEHIEPSLGAIKLRKLDVATLDSFYRALTKKGLAPATVRQAHAVIRSALTQGVRWDWVPIKLRREGVTAATPQSDHKVTGSGRRRTVGRTRCCWPVPRLATLIHLAVITGARRGELCGLRWNDLDDPVCKLPARSATT